MARLKPAKRSEAGLPMFSRMGHTFTWELRKMSQEQRGRLLVLIVQEIARRRGL